MVRKARKKTCRCAFPAEPPHFEVIEGRVVPTFPPGPLGAELIPFLDQDTGVWHRIECVIVGGDEGDQARPVPVERFMDGVHVAAFLGVKLATLYSWAPYLESADKRGGRLIFWTDDLVNVDIPQLENRLPKRQDVLAERKLRGASGEVLRKGRHIPGCPRLHRGPCTRTPRPSGGSRRTKKSKK